MIRISAAPEDRASTCSGIDRGIEQLACSPSLKGTRPYKIALTGDCGVGKTSLACRLSNPDWRFQQVKATIGADYRQRVLKVDDQLVKVHLCDTQGEEKFGRVTTSFYRVAHAIFLVFDVTNYETFQDLLFWVDEVTTYQHSELVVKALIGNKADQKSGREVDESIAKAFAEDRGLQYVETSACSGHNLETLLQDVCRKLLGYACSPRQLGGQAGSTETDGAIRLDEEPKLKKGTCLSC